MPNLIMVVNEDRFFLSHRKAIALAAADAGFDVHIVCKDTGQRKDVEALGLKMIELPINPTGMNPKEEFKTFRFLYNLYRKKRPDVVHHVGIKDILWGGLAAKLAKTHGVVNAVSGLGVLFSDKKPSLTTRIVMSVMKFSNHRNNISVIFQNHEDEDLFLRHGIVSKEHADFIKGSGADLNLFKYVPEPEEGPIKVIFTARMVKEKGILVLVEAAELLRSEMEGKAEFLLCGGMHNNPGCIGEEKLAEICDGKYIKWLGHRTDVPELLASSHIVAFPSYYREGVPLSLIEACAVGRPIVTTKSYGCKDTVDDGENGFLVPIKNSEALAEKLRILINDKALRQRMGLKGREKAEREFSLDDVVRKHIEIYKRLL